MLRKVRTYADLLAALQELKREQLKQQIQTAEPSGMLNNPVELKPSIAIGTVAEMEFYGSRSVVDNKYHADEVVILIDANPFGSDGVVAYELKDGNLDDNPIYGADGPTNIEDQLAPDRPQHIDDVKIQASSVAAIEWRTTTGNRYR